MPSPFSEILAHCSDALPACLRDQYLGVDDPELEVVLAGKMTSVWHRPGWLWPLFWLIAKWDLFFPETGTDIPTTLVITSTTDSAGRPMQIWDRIFLFPKVSRRYRSFMVYDPASRLIVEMQGPGNILHERAEIRFSSPGTIEFITVRSALQIGRWCVRLPRFLWVHGKVVQVLEADSSGRTRVTLTLTHPLLGPIFGYEGVFRATCRRRSS